MSDSDETVAVLADGWTLRSGVYNPNDPEAFTSGEYVRLVDPSGAEYCYWDQEEWREDPALVMGAIINTAAGLRGLKSKVPCAESDEGCEGCEPGYHWNT
jgi:hypothetical protein